MCYHTFVNLVHRLKMVPITGRASSFLEKNLFLKTPILKSKSNPSHCLLFFLPSVSKAYLSCVVMATIFSSLAFLSSSVSMTNLSRDQPEQFGSCIILQPWLFFLIRLHGQPLATTFSSHSFLSNSFSSPHFNLLRVGRRCFSWSSVSDDLFFFSSCAPSCSYLFHVLSSAFLSSVL